MRVSIIIPVYNVAVYIERCIRSVISQTYTNVECILIDDGSSDSSMEKACGIINRYCGTIEFVIVKQDRNRGLSVARNAGLSRSTGEYVYFLDSDDELEKDCISLLVEYAEKYKGVDLVLGNNLLNHKDAPGVSLKAGLPEYLCDKNSIQQLFFKTSLPCMAWNKLLRREFMMCNHLLFKEGIYHEDLLWCYFVAKHIHSLAICYAYTYLYVSRGDSITQTTDVSILRKRSDSWKIVIGDIVADMKKEGLWTMFKQYPYKCIMYYNSFILEMGCWKLYPTFWKFVWKIFIEVKGKYRIYDYIFYLNMLCPFSFLFKWNAYCWRFMNYIYVKL